MEDHLVRVPCLRREAAVQQVDSALAAGPRQREVACRLFPDRARDSEDPDGGDEPADEDDPAVSDGPARDALHVTAPDFHLEKICNACSYTHAASKVNTQC